MNLNQNNYYDDTEYLSHSQLKDFMHCPYLYNVKYLTKEFIVPEDEAKYFIIGRAVDVMLTAPDQYNNEFYTGDARKMTDDQKQALAHKTRLTPADEQVVIDCVNELARQPLYEQFQGKDWQFQVILTSEIEGVKCKGKVDRINYKSHMIVDDKTTRDITTFKPEQYATQMAFYRLLAGDDFTASNSIFINAVDKHAEFKRSCIYTFTDDVLTMAEASIREGIRNFKEAKKSGFFVPVTNTDEYAREEKCFRCPHYSNCPFSKQKNIRII